MPPTKPILDYARPPRRPLGPTHARLAWSIALPWLALGILLVLFQRHIPWNYVEPLTAVWSLTSLALAIATYTLGGLRLGLTPRQSFALVALGLIPLFAWLAAGVPIRG